MTIIANNDNKQEKIVKSETKTKTKTKRRIFKAKQKQIRLLEFAINRAKCRLGFLTDEEELKTEYVYEDIPAEKAKLEAKFTEDLKALQETEDAEDAEEAQQNIANLEAKFAKDLKALQEEEADYKNYIETMKEQISLCLDEIRDLNKKLYKKMHKL